MLPRRWRVQALTPASASDALISFRKPRRPTGSSHSDAFCGNSRCRNSLNSGVSATSSRLRQYSRPRVPSSLARSAWMSVVRSCAGHRWHVEQLVCALDAVLLHELRADHRLRHRGAVAHREHLAARPDVLLGIAMAVHAPLHLQRLHLPHQRHLVDAPVAGFAAHPLLHVDAVVEVDEVRQVVDADPVQRTCRPGSWRAPARESAPSTRSASGSSCRSWSAESRQTRTSRPRCGSSGSRSHRRVRDGDG